MVGEKIKRYRLEKMYSITELAEKAGVSKSYLSYIERGIQENPSMQVLSRLARTLGVTVEELMGDDSQETESHGLVDEEWMGLIDEAIRSGISKKEFAFYLDFIKFRNRNEN
ncbi:helix-turn-helix domain-containing protein [Bacillus sp. FJAT-27251]|uniref:helix-turn-helix domain-containing protein n=1 Tax=Bacillus sp. FJAT-27251 TaxID=1684142 RepID=UPI0006A75F04|nr:helix-turn-helix domain-containing protein [Bacillus sp. FJAT-27251]